MVEPNSILSRRCIQTFQILSILALWTFESCNANLMNSFEKARLLVRYHLNLSGKIVPRTTLPAYERMNACPAFVVATPWGSPYMIFDRLSTTESEVEQFHDNYFTGEDPEDPAKSSYRETIREQTGPDVMGEEEMGMQSEMEYEQTRQAYKTRTTALYFTDPDDAQHLVDEMKQMGNGMDKADIRVMTTSLGRAVRQASRLNHGLPTGQPVDELTGRLDRSSIRYKLVPSKREMFYAATRCFGKERVGFFGDTSEEDAEQILYSPRELAESRLGAKAMSKSMQKRKANTMSGVRRAWWNMRGKTGIPVFYADGMKRKVGRGSDKEEIPLFLSYEDLRTSWNKMKETTSPSDDAVIPEQPPMVEVFNFMDVVCAMERNQWEKRVSFDKALNNVSSNPFIQKMLPSRFISARNNLPKIGDDELDKLVFIPSSRSIDFKENTSKLGNGKARLRPMR